MDWQALLTGSAWTLSAQLASRISGVIAGILVARMLGPVGLGELAVARDIGVIAVPLFTLGISQVAVRFVARFRAEPTNQNLSEFVELLAIYVAIAAVVGAASTYALASILAEWLGVPSLEKQIMIIAAVLLISIPYEIVNSLMAGLEAFKVLAIRQAVAALVTPIVLYLSISAWAVSGALAAAGLINFVLLLYLVTHLVRILNDASIGMRRPRVAMLRDAIGQSLPLLGSILLMRPVNLMGSMILLSYDGLEDVGCFRIAYMFYGIAMLVSSAIQVPLLPVLSRMDSDREIEIAGIKILRILTFVGLPTLLVSVALSRILTTLAFGQQYDEASSLVAGMLVVSFWASLVATLETNVVSRGKTSYQLVVNVINLLVFLISALYFIPLLGASGLVLAYLTTEVVALCQYGCIQARTHLALIRPMVLMLGISVAMQLIALLYITSIIGTTSLIFAALLSIGILAPLLDSDERMLLVALRRRFTAS